ncbi:MAG: hypothetical protein RI922_1681 [Bacteroidota bacterium]|jgi:hypothetical protein
MKKLLLSIALFAGTFSATAQLANGSTAPDWTFTDLNGTSWNLYSLTAAGKTVFIDVSATWCGPCWAYHNSGALEGLYSEHGPSGTISQDVMVFYIEGDAATTLADLHGTGTNTQGDWVTGTPYPIIDPGAATNAFNTDYNIGYFPTIYKVCTDNKIYEVGQQNTAGLVASINSCPFATDVYSSAGPVSLQCATSFAPSFTLKNNGQTTLTSCSIAYEYDNNGSVMNMPWTGSLAAGATTTVSLPVGTFAAGAHTLQVTTTLPNGGADNNNTNNVQDYTFTVTTATGVAMPYTNNFSNATFPYTNWIVNNADNGITWARATTNGGALKYDCYNYSSAGQSDDFIIEPIDLTGGNNASLSFNVAHARYSASYTESLEVFVSTDCGATWTSEWSKSGATLATAANTTSAFTPTAAQWRAECVDLSAYAGNSKVFVKFTGTNGYGNNIYVDDISIANVVCSLGLGEEAAESFKVFPNPASDVVNVTFEAENSDYIIAIVDLQGRVMTSQELTSLNGSQSIALPVSNLAKGSYIVTISTNGVTTSKNVVIK